MMTPGILNDLIARVCLETIEDLKSDPDLAGDSQIMAIMLSAKARWQQDAAFLMMHKLRDKILSIGVPPNTEATEIR